MANNAHHAILRQGTSSPGNGARCGKPFVSMVMPHVCWIDQRYQQVHVEKKATHGNSSRSCWTSSDVTRAAPGRTGSKAIPFRVLPSDSEGRNAVRASTEITSPTLFRCEAASSFAAARTSSSIASVVLIFSLPLTSIIIHQTSLSQRQPPYCLIPATLLCFSA